MPEASIKKENKKALKYFLLVILALIASFAFAFALLVYSHYKNITNQDTINQNNYLSVADLPESKYINNQWREIINGRTENYLGSPNAKITIVEFGDFTCPHCLNAYPRIRELSTEYYSDIQLIFRHYPGTLTGIDLAMAAECAGEQGLFWPMHDKLFQNQDNIKADNIIQLATEIGANQDNFTNCIEERKYLDKITKDVSDGDTLEIEGTPTFFINGRRFSGDIPKNILYRIIDLILENK